MNEEKIREIVEKVIAENMPNKDEITQKAIEAVKESEKKENDKPWLIKKGETYYVGVINDGEIKASERKNLPEYKRELARCINTIGCFGRKKSDAILLTKARELQREYEQWCLKYPVDWDVKSTKYYSFYSYGGHCVQIAAARIIRKQGIIYCASKEHIQAFIDKIGEASFMIYVMGIGLPKYFLEV